MINVGKTTESFLREGEVEYENRIKHYIKFQRIDLKVGKKKSIKEIKREEAKQILSQVSDRDLLILLDEKGDQYTSVEFSKWIEKKRMSGKKNWVFLVGGPYGFDESIYTRSNERVSLSKMTFSHQMIRVIFLEQLYRAHTILNGERYHHN